MKLTDFFQHKFNSDPFAILDSGADELSDLAKAAGINWHECAHEVQLTTTRGPSAERFSKYAGHAPAVTELKLKGKVDIYSRMEVSKDGIRYPFVNFVHKGSDAGVWSGYQYLLSEFRRYQQQYGGTTVPLSQREIEQRQRAEARRKERERQAKIASLMESQRRDADLNEYLQFSQAFAEAPLEDGSWPYAVKKGISSVFSSCNVRRVTYWDRGHNNKAHKKQSVMAIPLSHIDSRYDGRIVGWQRITQNNVKLQTRAVDGGEFSGSCHIIGSLRGSSRVCVVEGFATGASVYITAKKRFDAVIVAVSANNVLKVVEQIYNLYPGMEVWCALDNDQKSAKNGKGNTGLKVGIEVMKKFPQTRCTYPIFNDDESELSDFNDLMLARGITETNRQLFSKQNRLALPANIFDAEMLALAVAPVADRRAFSRQLIRCIDAGMTQCPSKLSPQELISLIKIKLEYVGADKALFGTVYNRVKRAFKQKCDKAQAFRSFSERVTNPAIRPDHITYKRFDTPHMTREVLDYIKSLNGPVIVRAGMGSGKSKHLLRPMMHSAQRGVSVAHRVSLIGGLWDMMTRSDDGRRMHADILHYQDPGYQELAPYASKLTICINSIVKGCWQPLMKSHDFFGLDEATQGLRATLSGKAMAHPVDVFNKLIDAIAYSEDHALLVDADASDILVDICELAMARRETSGLSTWTQIHVVELPVDVKYKNATGERVARRVLYTDTDRIMVEVLKAVNAGEKFLLATDSTNFAEQLLLQLRDRWPEKKWLYVSQDTKPDQEVVEFTDAPNQRAKLYDGLIYSPAISSGVSIEEKHFTRHFGCFCGQVVPSDAIQMLRRDRTATEFMVGLNKLPGVREESAENIKRGFLQALLETAEINDEFTDAVLDGDRLSLGLADTTYIRMKFKVAAMEAQARNDFANNMICILYADGYNVSHLAEDETASAKGKELRKESKGRVWDMTVLRHIEAETPDENEHNELLARRSLSETEQAQLARWEIENELMLDVDEDSLKFLLEGGKKRLTLAELMTMDELTAARIDREQQAFSFTYQFRKGPRNEYVTITAINRETADAQFDRMQPGITGYTVHSRPILEVTQRTYASLHRKVAREYFSTCGIDPDTGAGEATQEGMKAAMEKLMDASTADRFNNVLRFGGYINPKGRPKRPETVFKQICESFGYATQKRRLPRSQGLGYVWSIVPASWEFIHGILARRAEASLSFVQMKLDVATAEIADLDCRSTIDIRSQVGSADTTFIDSTLTTIEEAIAAMPVPFAWLRTTLTIEELVQLATMPPRLIQATVAGLFMADNMTQLSDGQYNELKRLQAV
ncbi:hypothetical protein DNX92_23720 [Salmonella enterica subsp. enterica]|nr:hypothetical protein [Salmonella enterica subsp. enterica serovar Richmond]